jgi:peptidoglycan hydrolase-like protein with peptidoglycan-binding domain
VQSALKKAGFYEGDVDGKQGPKTKKAIRVFQKARGLKVDGVVGKATRQELNRYLD